jgi:pSer/pThr/pTyr-binding forkhead associated (FHA) protein
MSLSLIVLNGKKVGSKVSLSEGFSIGRMKGDLLIEDDPKISAIHAKIELDNKKQMVLMDMESSNGLVMNGRRVKKIAMMPGVSFRIGNTHFKVIKDEEEKVTFVKSTPDRGKKSQNAGGWKERVSLILTALESPPPVSQVKLTSFSPALVLDFVEGIQADQQITLGYGPRIAGFGHLDIDLIDPKIPDKAFELLPGPGSVQIRDLSGGKVLLNGKPSDKKFLQEGDVISVGNSKIKVRYL